MKGRSIRIGFNVSETGSVRIENGKMIVSAGGREWLIDVERTQLVKAKGEPGAIQFIKEILDRYNWDVDAALTMANLIPHLLPRKTESVYKRPERRTAEEPGRVFANKADRKAHEKLVRRHAK